MALHTALLSLLLLGAFAVVSSQVTLAPGVDPKYQFFIDVANTPIAKGDNFPGENQLSIHAESIAGALASLGSLFSAGRTRKFQVGTKAGGNSS